MPNARNTRFLLRPLPLALAGAAIMVAATEMAACGSATIAVGGPCTADADCDAGQVCFEAACANVCNTDSDCRGVTEICEAGVCIEGCSTGTGCECLIDGHCDVPPGDPACFSAECVSEACVYTALTGQNCGDPACDQGILTPAPGCTAAGVCEVSDPQELCGAGLACTNATTCNQSCVTTADCLPGFTCDGAGACDSQVIGDPCGVDSDCGTDGLCECTFANCTARACSSIDCPCGFTGDGIGFCDGVLANGLPDPSAGCPVPNGCFSGQCLTVNGFSCDGTDDADCGGGECECSNAGCTSHLCSATSCACQYTSTGTTCDGDLVNAADVLDGCDPPNGCAGGNCLNGGGVSCITNSDCLSGSCATGTCN